MLEQLGPTCDAAPVDCHLIDSDEIGLGVLTTRDGIHPTNEGSTALGEYVAQLMEAEGMRR